MIHDAHFLDPRDGAQILGEIPVVRRSVLIFGVFALRQREVDGEDVFGLKTRIYSQNFRETLHEQTGADQEQHRERDLAADEHCPRPPSVKPRTSPPARSQRLRRIQVGGP